MFRQPHADLPPNTADDETAARRDGLIRRAEESRQPFEPEAALFPDDSAESEQARREFEEAQNSFRTLSATGPDIPAAAFGDMLFVGNAHIGELVRTLKAIETVLVSNLRRTMPHLFKTDPIPTSSAARMCRSRCATPR